MNKKILLIATLILLTIVSLGSISATEVDDDALANADEGIEVADSTQEADITGIADTVDEDDISDEVDSTETISATEDPVLKQTIDIAATDDNDAIQAKLNTLTNDSVVNFETGVYNDINLVVKPQADGERLKNITINGNGATLRGTPIWGTDKDTDIGYYNGIFEIQKVDGFTLTGFNFIAEGVNQANLLSPSCVIVYSTTNGIVEYNNISGGRFGLYVGNKFQNANNAASNFNTTVRFNNVTGVTDMGIISFASPGSKILNNTVTNPANHGIDVRHVKGNNSVVKGNTVIGAREGIYLMHSSGHNATENKLINCAEGIVCYGSMNINIDYNNFTNTRIRILLSSGYRNITIGENNDFGAKFEGDKDVPMPPTFSYFIVRGDEAYVRNTSGTFSDGDGTVKQGNTMVKFYYISEEGSTVEFTDGSINQINTSTFGLNNVIVKILKCDDNNPIASGETIKVSIDGTDVGGPSDASGSVTIDLSTLAAGKHYVAVAYAGTTELLATSWSSIFEVPNGNPSPAPAPIVSPKATSIVASNIVSTAKVSKNLVFTLKDSTGALANKKVSISVNGKTTTGTTNAKGQVTIKTNFATAGTYYYSLCFLGDSNYKACFKTVKVTVNKQATKAVFKAKTFKVKATKKVSFTLKDASGKAIAGKKITFTVNKKTYTAKTNSKGIATVKVKITKKGNAKITAKFAGDNTYKAITKKATFKIK